MKGWEERKKGNGRGRAGIQKRKNSVLLGTETEKALKGMCDQEQFKKT